MLADKSAAKNAQRQCDFVDANLSASWSAALASSEIAKSHTNLSANHNADIHRRCVRRFPLTIQTLLGNCPDASPDAARTAAVITKSFANLRANLGASFGAYIHRRLVRRFPPTARMRLGGYPVIARIIQETLRRTLRKHCPSITWTPTGCCPDDSVDTAPDITSDAAWKLRQIYASIISDIAWQLPGHCPDADRLNALIVRWMLRR